MLDEEALSRRGKRRYLRLRRAAAICRLALMIAVVGLSLPAVASGQRPISDPVERLRLALQTTYPDATACDHRVKQCLAELRSLSDLQRAATLVEWQDTCLDDAAAAVDRDNQAILVDWFHAAVRRVLRQGDPPVVAETIHWLAQLAAQDHANHEPATLVGRFQSELADLVIEGPPRLRGVAARTLAQIEPSVYIAVPALSELLQAGDAEQRLAAADAFASLLQNASQALDVGTRVAQRPASRGELVLTASSVLPAVHHGLDDTQAQVRRRCLETIGLAAVALSRLIEDALPTEEQPGGGWRVESGGNNSLSTLHPAAQSLAAAREELRPLVQALRDQGPILARALADSDEEARIRTHRALEELGHAHGCWARRCAETGVVPEGSEEDLLREVLQETVPGLAAALGHPDMRVRRSALDALEGFGSLALPAAPALIRTLHDADHSSRWSAIRTLGKLGPPAAPLAIPALTHFLHDPDVDLRAAAATALTRLNPARFAASAASKIAPAPPR